MRPTLLGSLLDAARHNLAHGARTSRCSSRAPSTARATGPTRRRRAPRARRAPERRRWRRAPGAASAREADFFAAKALLEALLDRFHVSWSVARPSPSAGRSCTPAAARPCSPASETLGFLGELHPLVAGAVGPAAQRRVRDRPRQARRGRARGGAVPRLRRLPRAAPGHRGHAPRGCQRRRSCSSASATRPGATLGDARVFDVYTRRAGRRGPALAGAGAELPLARAHPHRRGRRARCASGSSPRSRSSEASCVAEAARTAERRRAPRVLVAGATGFAGALAAHLLWRHPGFELDGGHRPLGGRAARSQDLYPRYRVPLALEELDDPAASGERSTRRSSPTRTRPPRRRWRRCARRRARGRPQRRLPPAPRWRPTSTGTAPHPRPELIADAVYGLTELHREQIAGAGHRRQPRLLPDRLAARARAARARRA